MLKETQPKLYNLSNRDLLMRAINLQGQNVNDKSSVNENRERRAADILSFLSARNGDLLEGKSIEERREIALIADRLQRERQRSVSGLVGSLVVKGHIQSSNIYPYGGYVSTSDLEQKEYFQKNKHLLDALEGYKLSRRSKALKKAETSNPTAYTVIDSWKRSVQKDEEEKIVIFTAKAQSKLAKAAKPIEGLVAAGLVAGTLSFMIDKGPQVVFANPGGITPVSGFPFPPGRNPVPTVITTPDNPDLPNIEIPVYPDCKDLIGKKGDLAHYDEPADTHDIVGAKDFPDVLGEGTKGQVTGGINDIFSVTRGDGRKGDATQCYCPPEGERKIGIQFNWFHIGGTNQWEKFPEKVKDGILQFLGRFGFKYFEEKGQDWGLQEGPYGVRDERYVCRPEEKTPAPSPSPTSEGQPSPSASPPGEQPSQAPPQQVQSPSEVSPQPAQQPEAPSVAPPTLPEAGDIPQDSLKKGFAAGIAMMGTGLFLRMRDKFKFQSGKLFAGKS